MHVSQKFLFFPLLRLLVPVPIFVSPCVVCNTGQTQPRMRGCAPDPPPKPQEKKNYDVFNRLTLQGDANYYAIPRDPGPLLPDSLFLIRAHLIGEIVTVGRRFFRPRGMCSLRIDPPKFGFQCQKMG